MIKSLLLTSLISTMIIIDIFPGDFPWPMAPSLKMIGRTPWRMSQKQLEICSMDTTLGSVPILEVGYSHHFFSFVQEEKSQTEKKI